MLDKKVLLCERKRHTARTAQPFWLLGGGKYPPDRTCDRAGVPPPQKGHGTRYKGRDLAPETTIDRHTPVKTVPSPILRMWVVKMYI